MIRTTATTMPDATAAQLRLMAFLSPAFPVGGFSYSHGLERAAHDGLLPDADALREWLSDLIAFGSGWNDAVLFAEADRRTRDGGDIVELAELAEALAGSQERHRESMLQGAAFIAAARAWPHAVLERLPADCPYCVAAGAILGAHRVPLETALAAWLQAFAMNLVQAAIRLGVTGQQGAMSVIAALEPVILDAARRAQSSTLDDLGSATLLSEIVAMKHETQTSRLFRS
ncbi:urease accessory protein UreF [Mesorhizobium sp. KR9-304]|uniref:urease accessory protein UreF n=1 Tax=Mesorhizobium sp. KR9-304 TaxID=3156614 RepID=UPI0032B4C13E